MEYTQLSTPVVPPLNVALAQKKRVAEEEAEKQAAAVKKGGHSGFGGAPRPKAAGGAAAGASTSIQDIIANHKRKKLLQQQGGAAATATSGAAGGGVAAAIAAGRLLSSGGAVADGSNNAPPAAAGGDTSSTATTTAIPPCCVVVSGKNGRKLTELEVQRIIDRGYSSSSSCSSDEDSGGIGGRASKMYSRPARGLVGDAGRGGSVGSTTTSATVKKIGGGVSPTTTTTSGAVTRPRAPTTTTMNHPPPVVGAHKKAAVGGGSVATSSPSTSALSPPSPSLATAATPTTSAKAAPAATTATAPVKATTTAAARRQSTTAKPTVSTLLALRAQQRQQQQAASTTTPITTSNGPKNNNDHVVSTPPPQIHINPGKQLSTSPSSSPTKPAALSSTTSSPADHGKGKDAGTTDIGTHHQPSPSPPRTTVLSLLAKRSAAASPISRGASVEAHQQPAQTIQPTPTTEMILPNSKHNNKEYDSPTLNTTNTTAMGLKKDEEVVGVQQQSSSLTHTDDTDNTTTVDAKEKEGSAKDVVGASQPDLQVRCDNEEEFSPPGIHNAPITTANIEDGIDTAIAASSTPVHTEPALVVQPTSSSPVEDVEEEIKQEVVDTTKMDDSVIDTPSVVVVPTTASTTATDGNDKVGDDTRVQTKNTSYSHQQQRQHAAESDKKVEGDSTNSSIPNMPGEKRAEGEVIVEETVVSVSAAPRIFAAKRGSGVGGGAPVSTIGKGGGTSAETTDEDPSQRVQRRLAEFHARRQAKLREKLEEVEMEMTSTTSIHTNGNTTTVTSASMKGGVGHPPPSRVSTIPRRPTTTTTTTSAPSVGDLILKFENMQHSNKNASTLSSSASAQQRPLQHRLPQTATTTMDSAPIDSTPTTNIVNERRQVSPKRLLNGRVATQQPRRSGTVASSAASSGPPSVVQSSQQHPGNQPTSTTTTTAVPGATTSGVRPGATSAAVRPRSPMYGQQPAAAAAPRTPAIAIHHQIQARLAASKLARQQQHGGAVPFRQTALINAVNGGDEQQQNDADADNGATHQNGIIADNEDPTAAKTQQQQFKRQPTSYGAKPSIGSNGNGPALSGNIAATRYPLSRNASASSAMMMQHKNGGRGDGGGGRSPMRNSSPTTDSILAKRSLTRILSQYRMNPTNNNPTTTTTTATNINNTTGLAATTASSSSTPATTSAHPSTSATGGRAGGIRFGVKVSGNGHAAPIGAAGGRPPHHRIATSTTPAPTSTSGTKPRRRVEGTATTTHATTSQPLRGGGRMVY